LPRRAQALDRAPPSPWSHPARDRARRAKGVTVHVPIYADATYLFVFRTTASGIAAAIATLSAELAAGGARTDGSLVKATLRRSSPAEILLQPIFNPVGGYGSYIVRQPSC